MAVYRYLTAHLGAPHTKIAELSGRIASVEWQRLRNGAGVFSGTLKLPPPSSEVNKNLATLYKEATDRATTCLYVLRDNTPVGAYILWGQEYDSASQSVTLSGSELFSYFNRRIIELDPTENELDGQVVLDGVPMYDAVKDLMQRVNEIGVVLDIEAGGPALPTTVAATAGEPEIPGAKFRGTEAKKLGDQIIDWSNQEDGFDFRSDLVLTGGVFERRFVLRQQLGSKVDIVAKYGGLIAKTGGNVTSFGITRRGDIRSNDAIVVGATSISELGKRFSGRVTTDDFTPTMQNVYQLNEETDTDRLDAYAQAAIDATTNHEVIEIEIAAGHIDAEIGTFTPGDEFRFMVPPGIDAWYSQGLDTTVRTVGFKVKVPDTGGREIVTFQLEEDPFGSG